MASDVIESESVLKGGTMISDRAVNNSTSNSGGSDPVTPRNSAKELGKAHPSSPSTSGVSGEEGDDENDLEESQSSNVSAGDNGLSLTQTQDPEPSREVTAAAERRRSTPVKLSPTKSAPPGSLERQESISTTEARLRMEGVELKEEWQDEDFPRPLPEEELEDEFFAGASGEGDPGYEYDQGTKMRKKLAAPDISLTLDRSDGSILSDELDESTELDLDAIDTPSDNSNEFEWEDDLPKPKATELLEKGVDSVQEFTASEEREEGRRWRLFKFGDQEHKVDMKAIEPYKRVISHGGYYGDGLNAIIVFAVCFMPESNQPNYRYIMDNLFKYVIGTLELLVAENYMIVYLNGATSRKKMPTVGGCESVISRSIGG
ncbi:hypothetical protein WMY93_023505 [Mugilogobius chulae]|uniref:BCL2/adenovirus E1B 19 kDa protein-interacting protein 2 n=1 Tax=Mugilogobius chulae TaxID=88201 RepID=A0AAW0NGL7_9GOBI